VSNLLCRVGLPVLGVIALGAGVAACGGVGATSHTRNKQLTTRSEAAFGQHYPSMAKRRNAASIPTMMDTMSSSVHFHPRLSVWIKGKQMAVPANIGIDPTQDGMQMAGLHTHDSSGTIHVEAPRIRHSGSCSPSGASRLQLIGSGPTAPPATTECACGSTASRRTRSAD